MIENPKIAVLGLGYVGLPLAIEFAKVHPCLGFDINSKRIDALKSGIDDTLETTAEELSAAKALSFTDDPTRLDDCNIYIITVPTPIDEYKQPDLSPLIAASKLVGKSISKGDIVIYESTVYPGATEDDVLPHVEKVSGLKFNEDFFAGYSPERINPGDKKNRLPDIVKVTSGSTPKVAVFVDALYAKIIKAGTHLASSIKVAEAAKVIENTQRDLNIALINEFSLIFDKLGIDTHEVLDAAGTKWNFLPFKPGLVGGHCIGVDPYYLTHKVQALGYFPDVILAGRRINDGMGLHVVQSLIKKLIERDIAIKGARVLIMGLAFKEDCPDTRNTRVTDIIDGLREMHFNVDIHDPCVDSANSKHEYGIDLITPQANQYDAIILAVGHQQFIQMGHEKIKEFGKKDALFFDIKALFSKSESDFRL